MRNRVLMLLAAAFCSTASGSVFAADMAVPRANPPPFIYNWSGFYLGAHIGYGWDHRDAEIFDSTGASLVSGSTQGSRVLGGAQIGINFAVAPQWIVGIEADYSGTNMGSTAIDGPAFGQRENNIDSFGTVRARVGYAWDRFLIFGSGGFGWAHEVLTRTQQIGTVNNAIPGTIEEVGATVPGWSAGLGLEWGVSPGWALRAEYLHLDLTSKDFAFVAAGQSIQATARIDAVRLGVNYIFNVGGPRAY
ncbi:MAG TPA: outer membrane beta-barrel protein [Pseudolabrys sp.]|nr:outer membrane beta-barrel protein [Pseudolabrys sp.]